MVNTSPRGIRTGENDMSKKWTDPLDRLIKADETARTLKDYLDIQPPDQKEEISSNGGRVARSQEIVEIDVKKIVRWQHKDRPEDELGNINDLADTFLSIGQQQPCILRHSKTMDGYYELIVGERRWKAAELAHKKLKSIICDVDDKTASIIQAIENEKRVDLSEYAKGMSYADKIEKGLLTQKDLIEILGISKQQVTRLLSYKRIPQPILKAIGDFRKVSARTAEEIARLANKGEEYVQILIDLAEKISLGKCGHNAIKKEIEKNLSKNKKDKLPINKKILSKNGRHLFTWRLDNNATPSIHFPKDIIKLFEEEIIVFDELTTEVKEWIANKLTNIQE